MSKYCQTIFSVVIILTLTGCLGQRKAGGVTGFRNWRVYVKDAGSYSVGNLPSSWRRMRLSVRAVAFHNKKVRATISTDAFCKKDFEDIPLNLLTSNLFAGIEQKKIVYQENFYLDGRGAQRTVATGFTDGMPVKLDAVVVKKNNCSFDFVCISPPENYLDAVGDFERFFYGFHYE